MRDPPFTAQRVLERVFQGLGDRILATLQLKHQLDGHLKVLDFVGGPVWTRGDVVRLCLDAFSQQLQGLVQVLLGSVELPGLLIAHLSRLSPHLYRPAPPPPHMRSTPSLSATDSLPIASSGHHSLNTPHRSPLSVFLYALCKDLFLPFQNLPQCLLLALLPNAFFAPCSSAAPALCRLQVCASRLQLDFRLFFLPPVLPPRPRWRSSCNKALLLSLPMAPAMRVTSKSQQAISSVVTLYS